MSKTMTPKRMQTFPKTFEPSEPAPKRGHRGALALSLSVALAASVLATPDAYAANAGGKTKVRQGLQPSCKAEDRISFASDAGPSPRGAAASMLGGELFAGRGSEVSLLKALKTLTPHGWVVQKASSATEIDGGLLVSFSVRGSWLEGIRQIACQTPYFWEINQESKILTLMASSGEVSSQFSITMGTKKTSPVATTPNPSVQPSSSTASASPAPEETKESKAASTRGAEKKSPVPQLPQLPLPKSPKNIEPEPIDLDADPSPDDASSASSRSTAGKKNAPTAAVEPKRAPPPQPPQEPDVPASGSGDDAGDVDPEQLRNLDPINPAGAERKE